MYHFVMNTELYEELQYLAGLLRTSISGAVVTVLEDMYYFLEARHLIAPEEGARYGRVYWTHHCWVKMYRQEQRLYRKVKALHMDLNTYSMAQIVRLCLRAYIAGVREHGLKEYRSMLMRSRRKHNRQIRAKRIWHKSQSQLWFNLIPEDQRHGMKVQYNAFSSPSRFTLFL